MKFLFNRKMRKYEQEVGKAVRKRKAEEEPAEEEPAKGRGRGSGAGGGREVCRAWNRSATGCETTCPRGRAHACEICRGPHWGVDCPQKPAVYPPKRAQSSEARGPRKRRGGRGGRSSA